MIQKIINNGVIEYKDVPEEIEARQNWQDEEMWLTCNFCGATFKKKRSDVQWDNTMKSLYVDCATEGCPNKILL